MDVSDLKKIGLTEGEIRIYDALLELGETTRTLLAKKSGISPSKIYDVANRLLEKGIISSVKKQGIIHFSAADPDRLKDFLHQTVAKDVRAVLATQRELIRELVRHAAEEQWTVQKLEQEFRDRHIRNERHRSMMIARTETAKLYNKGATEGMAEAGLATKEWLSARDEDVRDSHMAMDGQAVGLNDDFILPSGGRGPFPGQIDRADESINCRCTVIPGDV